MGAVMQEDMPKILERRTRYKPVPSETKASRP